jgi:hypothetical protein
MRAALVCALLFGCGDDDGAPELPSSDVLADVRALQDALADDTATRALEDVDDVAETLPVRAADMLTSGVIPAARRQADAVEAVSVTTERGRTLKAQALGACRARVTALEEYVPLLERGRVEDYDLVANLRAQREAETALVEVLDALEAIHPAEPDRVAPDMRR